MMLTILQRRFRRCLIFRIRSRLYIKTPWDIGRLDSPKNNAINDGGGREAAAIIIRHHGGGFTDTL